MTLPRQACNSLHFYDLFSSTSRDPPRLWTRSESSGRESCCKPGPCLISAKLKQRVQERTQDNNGPGILAEQFKRNEIAAFTTMTNPNLTRNLPRTHIRIRGVVYYVPQDIYDILLQIYPTLPNFTLSQLQQEISIIRSLYNFPNPNVLKNVPLSQYKKRYVYNENNKNWKYEQDKDVSLVRNYSIVYSVLNLVNVNMNVFNDMGFLGQFGLRQFQSQNAQFITVVKNTGCSYTNKIKELFPNGSASYWGNTLLPIVSKEQYYKNGSTLFYPEFVIVQPQSWDIYGGANSIKFGMLIGMNVESIDYIKTFLDSTVLANFNAMLVVLLPKVLTNSELIFIPIQNEVELIQNVNYKSNTGIKFPITSGGITTQTSLIEFNQSARTYYQVGNPNYKLLKNNEPIKDFILS
jgi:hypothetical protein